MRKGKGLLLGSVVDTDEMAGGSGARMQQGQPVPSLPQHCLPEVQVVGASVDEDGRQRGAQVFLNLQRQKSRPAKQLPELVGEGRLDVQQMRGVPLGDTYSASCPGVQVSIGEDYVAGSSQI